MDEIVKLSLLDEVDTQCLLAINSFDRMNELISNPVTKQLKEVWQYLQAFLAHSGILGSLVFKQGNPEKTKKVTDYLKEELKIDEESAIRERGGRNFLEHIEAFEIYAANRNDEKGIIQMVFDNKRGFEYMKSERYYYKRVLVVEEMSFIYQNQEAIKEMSLNPIISEVRRILRESDNARNRLNIIQN